MKPRDEAVTLLLEHPPRRAVRRMHDRPALVLPLQLGAIELELTSGLTAGSHRVDRAALALLPAHEPYKLTALGPVTEVATLLLGPAAWARAAEEYEGHVQMSRLEALFARAWTLPRTRWVDELVHRYLFERNTCNKHDSQASRFLETELTKELYFLCDERDAQRTRATVLEGEDDVVRKARAILDDNLFASPKIATLAKRCHTSESTLLRAFKRELDCAPIAYVRERRLDAALLLVQSGQHTVGEVATKVGYGSLAAFTAAFHRRFGKPPSAIRAGDEKLTRLPPHGRPPQVDPPRRLRRSG